MQKDEKMFKYDFIILYEHRKRELENSVLLAMMLEMKGYKVAIEHRRSVRILFQKADVILTPFLYTNEQVIDFSQQLFCHCKKIINLQYEQVFPKIDEEKLNNLPDECAKKAVHISWGRNMTERYKRIGIKSDNIFEIGHISIDLNMPKYRKVFLNKKSMACTYNIPFEKKWLLFISSFSCIGLPEAELENWKSICIGTEYVSKISYETQPIILGYFENLIKTHPDLIVIYRPHPHEMTCDRLIELEKKYDNFKVIADYSIRQWILVSDYISTWCSTSLVDVFYAQKPCAIIRPIPFLEDYDYNIYRDQKILSSYQELEEFVNHPNENYKVKPNSISKYYCNSSKANAFEKLCDVCIRIKNEKKYENNFLKIAHVSRLYPLKFYIYKILLSLTGLVDYSKFVPKKYHEDFQYAHREMKRYKEEISFYKERFSRMFEK